MKKTCVHVSPLALYDTSNKTSLPSLKNKNKINHKKKGANEREITFEKFRELQSETVAIATLYQWPFSIFHMDALYRIPLTAWTSGLCLQPRSWPMSCPSHLELQGQKEETQE